jgi:CelD/BcsL family acetyltransferase involved in cellulose biosynthesis
LATLEKLWQNLDQRGSHSFFVTWTCIGTWLRLIPWDFAPRFLTVHRADDLVGAAFLVPRREKHGLARVRQLHFNSTGEPEFDCVTIEHNNFARVDGNAGALWLSFMQFFAKNHDADELVIPGMTGENIAGVKTAGTLLAALRFAPAFRVCTLDSVAGPGVEGYLSRNSRQQLRRSMRHYLQHGPFRVEEAGTTEEALSFFSALKDFHIKSWTARGKHHAFRYPFFEEFHRALITSGIPKGSVQLLRLSGGDRVIGYLYNFRHGKRIYAYQSGFDHSEREARPGYVCHALAIDHNARSGAEVYDFLAGDNRLKQTFANDRYLMSWCTYRKRGVWIRAEMLARSAANRLASGSHRLGQV